MRIRQGQCDNCRIAWNWTINVPLRYQVCAECSLPLARVDRRARADCGYTWMNWDDYRPTKTVKKKE